MTTLEFIGAVAVCGVALYGIFRGLNWALTVRRRYLYQRERVVELDKDVQRLRAENAELRQKSQEDAAKLKELGEYKVRAIEEHRALTVLLFAIKEGTLAEHLTIHERGCVVTHDRVFDKPDKYFSWVRSADGKMYNLVYEGDRPIMYC